MSRTFIEQYLSFTKKERNGTRALLLLIALLLMVPLLFPLLRHKKNYPADEFKKELATLSIQQADSSSRNHRKQYDYYAAADAPGKTFANTASEPGTLFSFDPNTLSENGWKKLGLHDKLIVTIKKYLSKGGKFREPEDIKKIWGLNPSLADKLLPYVQIESTSAPQQKFFAEQKPTFEKQHYPASQVEINSADSTALITLPGIGTKLSQRIINFRDKLGGFYNINQVGETFGLPDSVFQKIKDRLTLNPAAIKQININTATLDDLKIHPYLRYALANAIVQYRAQHGQFAAVTDLKKIMIITEEAFSKAAPYLRIN